MQAGNGCKIPPQGTITENFEIKAEALITASHSLSPAAACSSLLLLLFLLLCGEAPSPRSLARRSFHFPRSVDNLMTAVSPDERTREQRTHHQSSLSSPLLRCNDLTEVESNSTLPSVSQSPSWSVRKCFRPSCLSLFRTPRPRQPQVDFSSSPPRTD